MKERGTEIERMMIGTGEEKENVVQRNFLYTLFYKKIPVLL